MYSKLLWFVIIRLAVTDITGDAYIPRERDFNANLQSFNQIVQLLHGRVRIPFSAMADAILPLPQILEVDPLDLDLLPCRYCNSCDTAPHPTPENSALQDPLRDRMVEVEEKQIIMSCINFDEKHGLEFPVLKACRRQHKILKQFLIDIRTRGIRLVIPGMLLEKTPHLEWNYATKEDECRCMEKDESGSSCSIVSTERRTIKFNGATRSARISMDGNFVDVQRRTYLEVVTEPTSSLPVTTSTNFRMPSQSYTWSTPVPSDDEGALPSGYYESFWSSMLNDFPDHPFFTTLSPAVPSTMVSIVRKNASATSETTVATAIFTDTPFLTKDSSNLAVSYRYHRETF